MTLPVTILTFFTRKFYTGQVYAHNNLVCARAAELSGAGIPLSLQEEQHEGAEDSETGMDTAFSHYTGHVCDCHAVCVVTLYVKIILLSPNTV